MVRVIKMGRTSTKIVYNVIITDEGEKPININELIFAPCESKVAKQSSCYMMDIPDIWSNIVRDLPHLIAEDHRQVLICCHSPSRRDKERYLIHNDECMPSIRRISFSKIIDQDK